MSQSVKNHVASPCRHICIVKKKICTGCGRTLDEIAAWPTAPDAQRRAIIARAKARLDR